MATHSGLTTFALKRLNLLHALIHRNRRRLGGEFHQAHKAIVEMGAALGVNLHADQDAHEDSWPGIIPIEMECLRVSGDDIELRGDDAVCDVASRNLPLSTPQSEVIYDLCLVRSPSPLVEKKQEKGYGALPRVPAVQSIDEIKLPALAQPIMAGRRVLVLCGETLWVQDSRGREVPTDAEWPWVEALTGKRMHIDGVLSWDEGKLIVTDILEFEGQSLVDYPLYQRLELLDSLSDWDGTSRCRGVTVQELTDLMDAPCPCILKPLASPYPIGDRCDWRRLQEVPFEISDALPTR